MMALDKWQQSLGGIGLVSVPDRFHLRVSSNSPMDDGRGRRPSVGSQSRFEKIR